MNRNATKTHNAHGVDFYNLFSAARLRRPVRLDDGREGFLIGVSPRSRVVRVVIAGRHYRVPFSCVVAVLPAPRQA